MSETSTQRLLEAATALSKLLHDHGVAHAFHGNVLTAVLANAPHSNVGHSSMFFQTIMTIGLQEILCICEGGQGQHHPFRRVREATQPSDDFTVTHSPWSNR